MAVMINASTEQPQASKGLRIALWIVQGLLIVSFGGSGAGKIPVDYNEFAKVALWVKHVSPGMVKFIGVMEVLGALGLLLPSVTRVMPKLTVAAAIGLLAIMVLAAGLHISIGEPQYVVINAVLGAMAVFVAWGRWKKAPIAPR